MALPVKFVVVNPEAVKNPPRVVATSDGLLIDCPRHGQSISFEPKCYGCGEEFVMLRKKGL
jgi:hypothetical protein